MALMLFTIAAALQAATPQIQVDAGRGDWSAFPPLQRVSRPLPTVNMVTAVERLLAEQACSFPGQSPSRFSIDVPFAALVEPDGSTRRIVVQDVGCPGLETMVGQAAVVLARNGDFRPTGESRARWYRDTISFNLR